MGIWERIEQAKQKDLDTYNRWYRLAQEERILASYGENASEDTLARLYGVRRVAEGLWKELFDV